jgi:hypothetical protein
LLLVQDLPLIQDLPAKRPAPPFRKPGTEAFSFQKFRPALLTVAANTNNPLMIRTQHWKSLIVLPTFRLSVIGA